MSEQIPYAEVHHYRYPPVDPETGEISAGRSAILMGELRHSEVPQRFRRPDCHATMHEHGWLDVGGEGITICPSATGPFAGQTVTERGQGAVV